ncbi:hydrolase [Methylobacterium sp. BTF04]|nr:hydrolase [Methylobacterium sp. BTF04]
MRPPEIGHATLVSCDVFDTLLHRDHRSETRRLRDVAVLASRRLAECGFVRDPATVWRTRIDVQRHAYRALDLADPSGDVRFADIVDAMSQILALDARGAAILHEAEIAVERRQLAPNQPLFSWLGTQAKAGRRIIAVSDTYHTAATIAHLLDTLAPGHPIAAIHTSADYDATKRTGAIFPKVLHVEGVHPGDVLHIGDDFTADVAMARAKGIRAWQVVRPRHVRLRRKMDAVRARLLHALSPTGPSARLGSRFA